MSISFNQVDPTNRNPGAYIELIPLEHLEDYNKSNEKH